MKSTNTNRLEVEQAHKEGHLIQVQIENTWICVPEPLFNWDSFNYRVSPYDHENYRP